MEIKKKVTRKEQAIATRKKILESAYLLFSKHGLKQVSIEMITRKAGIAKGTFYVYFKTKNALIAEIGENKVIEVDMNYEKILDQYIDTVPADELLKLMCQKIISVMIDNVGYEVLSIMYKMLLEKSPEAESVISSNRKVFELFTKIIEKGVNTGVFRPDLNSSEIAKHLMIALRGLTYQWCAMYPEFDLRATSDRHISLIIKGLK